MSTNEISLSAASVSSYFQGKLEDMLPEEMEDLSVALFNIKTRIVTDEEDDRTFFEFSKVLSMQGNALFDQFSGEMHSFSSMADNTAWFVEYSDGKAILDRALGSAGPEFLSEVVADQLNVDVAPIGSDGQLVLRQHATTQGVGDEVSAHFFNEAKRIMSGFNETNKPAVGPRI